MLEQLIIGVIVVGVSLLFNNVPNYLYQKHLVPQKKTGSVIDKTLVALTVLVASGIVTAVGLVAIRGVLFLF